jgi:hypothetical protein
MERVLNGFNKEINVMEVSGLGEAMKEIRNLKPGILLLDSDGTCRSHWRALKRVQFGFVPNEYLGLIDEMRDKKWKIAIITNQPYPGHQVAGVLSKLGSGYEAFPYCYENRGIKIFGANWRFLTDNFKRSDLAVTQVIDWMFDETKYLPEGNVVMVGDRQSDVDFSGRLNVSLCNEHDFSGTVRVYKIPGVEDSKYKVVRKMARFVP